MVHLSAWERLSDAMTRIMEQTGLSQPDAQMHICRAISDRTIKIRGRLESHTTKPLRASTVLNGSDFFIPAEIKPADLDWGQSRPVKPWLVRREISRTPGYWLLNWVELSRADVTNAYGAWKQGHPNRSVKTRMKRRKPTRERALAVIAELYPGRMPDQVELPNSILCRQIGDKLKEKGLPDVSDDTILRAARRRK